MLAKGAGKGKGYGLVTEVSRGDCSVHTSLWVITILIIMVSVPATVVREGSFSTDWPGAMSLTYIISPNFWNIFGGRYHSHLQEFNNVSKVANK